MEAVRPTEPMDKNTSRNKKYGSKKSEEQNSTSSLLASIARDVHEERDKENAKTAAVRADSGAKKPVRPSVKKTATELSSSKEVKTANQEVEANNEEDSYSSDEDQDPEPSPQQHMQHPETDDEDETEFTEPSDSTASRIFTRAVYSSDIKVVKSMLSSGDVDINVADKHGWTGLHWAASQGNLELVKYLLTKKCVIDAKECENGWTALQLAVISQSVSVVKALRKAGANPDVVDKFGDTARDCAASAKLTMRKKILKYL